MKTVGLAVHILRYGFALCKFSDRVPMYWPEGHRWVGTPEEGANCEACIEEYHRLKEPK